MPAPKPHRSESATLPPARTLILRALARRCPVCGRGKVFASHFKMNAECPSCHVVFWKDPGESLGAMYLDYAVATVAFLGGWILLSLFARLTDTELIATLGVAAVASVLIFFPFTRSAWTVLVYVSGGIERPRIRAIRGGRR